MISISLRIIFAGTSSFSAFYLKELICSQHKVVCVLTKQDQYKKNGKLLILNEVKQLSEKNNLNLMQLDSINTIEVQEYIKKLQADIIVVVSYGLIIPQKILDIPPLGGINLHFSLLPRWRGAAPIQRAILFGDKKTGISIIQMNSNIDSGSILHKISCKIKPYDTSKTLCNKLSKLGLYALFTVLSELSNKKIFSTIQDEKYVTYAHKINKEEAKINWNYSSIQLDRCIRAFDPWPISYFYINKQLIKVWESNIVISKHKIFPGTVLSAKHSIDIAIFRGVLKITLLQLTGRKKMLVRDFLNARYKWFEPGTVLN